MPGPRGRGDLRRARNLKATVLRLFGYLRPHALMLAVVVLLTLASSVFGVLQPTVTGSITTALFDGTRTGSFDWPNITRLLLTLVVIFVSAQAFQALTGIIMNRMTIKILQGMRDEVDAKVHRLPLDYYDARASGEILSVITNDVDMVDGAISRNLTHLVSQFVTVVGIFVMMVRISGWLTLIAVLMVPVSLVASLGVIRKSAHYFADQQRQLGDLNGYIEELYDGHPTAPVLPYVGVEADEAVLLQRAGGRCVLAHDMCGYGAHVHLVEQVALQHAGDLARDALVPVTACQAVADGHLGLARLVGVHLCDAYHLVGGGLQAGGKQDGVFGVEAFRAHAADDGEWVAVLLLVQEGGEQLVDVLVGRDGGEGLRVLRYHLAQHEPLALDAWHLVKQIHDGLPLVHWLCAWRWQRRQC